jgi:hypothetical protein
VSSNSSRTTAAVLIGAMSAMLLIFLFYVMLAGDHSDTPMPFITTIAAVIIFVALFIGPPGRALARMLEGRSSADDNMVLQVDELETRVQEMVLEQQRLQEIEERLDFAERLLAQRPAGTALPGMTGTPPDQGRLA